MAMMFRKALARHVWTARRGLTHRAPCAQRSLDGAAAVVAQRLGAFRVEDVTLP